jgi:hypothetical protein
VSSLELKAAETSRSNSFSFPERLIRPTKPLPERISHLNTDAESAPGALVNQSGRTDQSVAPMKKKAIGAARQAARAAKTTKAPQRPPR